MHFFILSVSFLVIGTVCLFGWGISKSCVMYANFDVSWYIHLLSALFAPLEFLLHAFTEKNYLTFGGNQYQLCRHENWVLLDIKFEWLKWVVGFSIIYDIFVGIVEDIVKNSR
jgi:hypothetical protein